MAGLTIKAALGEQRFIKKTDASLHTREESDAAAGDPEERLAQAFSKAKATFKRVLAGLEKSSRKK
jgi:hypothetical protein